MAAQIIDGKAVAAQVRDEVTTRAQAFAQAHGRAPGLEVVLVGDDPASQVYVRNKEQAAAKVGIRGKVHVLSATTTAQELKALVGQLNQDPAVDGILVQLPLPVGLDAAPVIESLDPRKDVDGLHPHNAGLLMAGRPGLRPCTPLGCMRLLQQTGVQLEGKKAVVLGRSQLVGLPMARMLTEAHASVTVLHSRSQDIPATVHQADVVVAAAGKPELLRADWVRNGAVVIDVGIHRRAEGGLCGDVAFDEVSAKASWITPVPGGVGPMTIAMLLSNTLSAAEQLVAQAN